MSHQKMGQVQEKPDLTTDTISPARYVVRVENDPNSCRACDELFWKSKYWRECREAMIQELRRNEVAEIQRTQFPKDAYVYKPNIRFGVECLEKEAKQNGWKTTLTTGDYLGCPEYNLKVEKPKLMEFPVYK